LRNTQSLHPSNFDLRGLPKFTALQLVSPSPCRDNRVRSAPRLYGGSASIAADLPTSRIFLPAPLQLDGQNLGFRRRCPPEPCLHKLRQLPLGQSRRFSATVYWSQCPPAPPSFPPHRRLASASAPTRRQRSPSYDIRPVRFRNCWAVRTWCFHLFPKCTPSITRSIESSQRSGCNCWTRG